MLKTEQVLDNSSDEEEASDLLEHFSSTKLDGLFSVERAPHKPRKPRPRTPDGGLLIAWRAPDWALPSLPPGIRLSSQLPLEKLSSRQACPACGKARRFFCYDCLKALTLPNETPRVDIPFKVDVILHREEKRNQCTAIHAALLAPSQVQILPLPLQTTDWDPTTTVVLYPSSESQTINTLDRSKITNVIVIESKWKRSKSILKLAQLSKLPHVRLESWQTSFWRYHTRGVGAGSLSTIEAIHYLCREWHAPAHEELASKCHCYDDLLWYFTFLHKVIEDAG